MVSKYFLRAHLGGVGGGPGAGPGVHDPVRLVGERLGVDREPGALQPRSLIRVQLCVKLRPPAVIPDTWWMRLVWAGWAG